MKGTSVSNDTAAESIADSTSMAAMDIYWIPDPTPAPRCCRRIFVLRRKWRSRKTIRAERERFKPRETER